MQMAGGAGNAIGALIQGRQQRNEIDRQRDIEQFNIKVGEQNAALSGQQTSAREEEVRRRARRALGQQRAAIGQSGTGFSGSNESIMAQSSTNAELDALNVRYAGQLERMGILNDVSMRKYNDKVLKKQGKQAMRLRWFNAVAGFFGSSGVQQQIGQAMAAREANQATGAQFGGAYGSGMTGYGLQGGYGSIGGYTAISGGSGGGGVFGPGG
jgi:hypothetical protein